MAFDPDRPVILPEVGGAYWVDEVTAAILWAPLTADGVADTENIAPFDTFGADSVTLDQVIAALIRKSAAAG